MNAYFITAIDTDAGKTVTTGLLARYFLHKNHSCISAKIVECGTHERISADILLHRKLMGIPLQNCDKQGISCPYIFKLPASPHLAAEQAGNQINPDLIIQNIRILGEQYDQLLIEGAGGLQVPLTRSYTILDLIRDMGLPVIVVSTPKLGSINHSILTLEALVAAEIRIAGVVYNEYISALDVIKNDSKRILKSFFPEIPLIAIPSFDLGTPPDIDFDLFFQFK